MSYAIMLIENNRSKSYLQNFIRFGYTPDFAIVLGEENCTSEKQAVSVCRYDKTDVWFDENTSVFTTLRSHGIPFTAMPTKNANDISVVEAVKKLSVKNLVYCGPGGVILKEEILSQGVRFFHSHPGTVPKYRGSTTFYYSMYASRTIGCSVMLMSPGLDAGDVVVQMEYPAPSMPANYDMVVDPIIRTKLFLSLFDSVQGNLNNAKPVKQEGEGNMFFIIHPVLKHLAMLGMSEEPDI